MKKLVVVLVVGLAFCFSLSADAQQVLTSEEARDILIGLIPEIEILDIRPAVTTGLWEISFKSGGRKSVIYMDSSKENIIVGQIIDIKTQENLTRKRVDELNQVDFSQIPLEGVLVMGNPNAPHKVIVFDDPD